jgi:hypothetical protein
MPSSIPCSVVLRRLRSPTDEPDNEMSPLNMPFSSFGVVYETSVELSFPLPLTGLPFARVVVTHDVKASFGVTARISVDGLQHDSQVDQLWWARLERGAEEVLSRGAGLRVVRWIWSQVQRREL